MRTYKAVLVGAVLQLLVANSPKNRPQKRYYWHVPLQFFCARHRQRMQLYAKIANILYSVRVFFLQTRLQLYVPITRLLASCLSFPLPAYSLRSDDDDDNGYFAVLRCWAQQHQGCRLPCYSVKRQTRHNSYVFTHFIICWSFLNRFPFHREILVSLTAFSRMYWLSKFQGENGSEC